MKRKLPICILRKLRSSSRCLEAKIYIKTQLVVHNCDDDNQIERNSKLSV